MFLKFPSLENSCQHKFVTKWIENNPELKDCKYEATEKLDGSNFGIIITNKSISFQRRTDILKEDEKFFNYQEVTERYMNDIKKIQENLADNEIIHLFCELIGKKILGRVQYTTSDKNELRIISLFLNGKLMPKLPSLMFLTQQCGLQANDLSCELAYAPSLGLVNGIEEAMNFNEIFNSRVLNIENNEAEGIVIQPYDRPFSFTDIDGNTSYFILKKKNPKFHEKEKKVKEFKVEELSDLIDYVNESRILSCFSKYGEIQESKEIGNYIKLVTEDIIIDAEKDGILNIESKAKKIGTYIAKELKKYL